MKLFGLSVLLLFLALCPVEGAEPKQAKKAKDINFDGEVVEGSGRQPMDSLIQTSESSKKKVKLHLYEKRVNTSDRNLERIEEIVGCY